MQPKLPTDLNSLLEVVSDSPWCTIFAPLALKPDCPAGLEERTWLSPADILHQLDAAAAYPLPL